MTTTQAPVWNPYVAQTMAALEASAGVEYNSHLDALAQSSSALRNLQLLSKVPRAQAPPAAAAHVALASDDGFRFGAAVTRVRKSALPAGQVDRFASESYPFLAPYVPAVVGQDTRWLRRGSEITPIR